jgi:S1-C subfamily serine protease
MEVDVTLQLKRPVRGRSFRARLIILAAGMLLTLFAVSLALTACGSASSSSSTTSGAGISTTISSSGGSANIATSVVAQTDTSTTLTPPVVDSDLQADLNSPAQVVLNTVYPSVVNIRVIATINGQTNGGVGSGVVYTADGLILTNEHVVTLDEQVTTGQQITVTFGDQSTAPATIVGTDPQRDVAAIKVEKTGLLPVTFGATKDVHLAEWAIVIGSPLDFQNTVTLGIVSGLNRTLDTGTGAPLTGLMQVDTPISPGNSGGGCFDTAGRFIGMPEVYLPPAQTGAENIGFCIPADVVAAAGKSLTGK